jgi:excisionase family DNA binding protein
MQEPLLSPRELADWLGIPIGTIYRWNHTGDGPTPLSIGRHVRYRQSDVEDWLNAHEVGGDGRAVSSNGSRASPLSTESNRRRDDGSKGDSFPKRVGKK